MEDATRTQDPSKSEHMRRPFTLTLNLPNFYFLVDKLKKSFDLTVSFYSLPLLIKVSTYLSFTLLHGLSNVVAES